jgi:hypothetical protein
VHFASSLFAMLSTRPFTGTPLHLATARSRAVVVKCLAQPRRQAATQAVNQATSSTTSSSQAPLLAAGALLAPYVLDVTASLAAGGEYGLLEGRWVSPFCNCI